MILHDPAFPATAFSAPAGHLPNEMLLPAAIFCMATYVDAPNAPDATGTANVEAAVKAIYPTCEVVWSCADTYDDNYAFIVRAPGNKFFLAIRGSLPFEVNNHVVVDWGIIANWLIEDFAVYRQDQWPYVNPDYPEAYVARGAMTGFTNVQEATNYFGSTSGNTSGQLPLSALAYLQEHAVQHHYPVYITGHSLGGNIANVYASYFAQQCPGAEAYVFTFAAPAAGDQAFVDDLQGKFPEGRAWHYEMQFDIIPRFPVLEQVRGMKELFDEHCRATDVSFLGVSLADLLQLVIDSLKLDKFLGIINPYVATEVQTGQHELSKAYRQNTFEDWFMQAAYQHKVAHYVRLFLADKDAITAIVKAMQGYISRPKERYSVQVEE